MEIRSYRPGDLNELYEISVLTGAGGEDATGLYEHPELLGHVYVAPFAVHHPELAFVAADAEGVAGYVLGAADVRPLADVLERDWWPDLRRRYPLGTAGDADRWLVELIHRPTQAPAEVLDRYPSEFHIDLLARCQGHGAGRRLIDRLLRALGEAGSPGVHCGVDPLNERAIGFYTHLGFERADVSEGVVFVMPL